MKRVYIDGGDNCYCARCGGVGDRSAYIVEGKTIMRLPVVGGEFCLGRWCWFLLGYNIPVKDTTWRLERVGTDCRPKYQLHNTETDEVIPATVKGGKWGKDGEFGKWGRVKRVGDEYILVDYETERPTGWRFGEVAL